MSGEMVSEQTDSFDVIVLGGGTGGYVAAIRAAQLGLRAAVIEADKVGGTCLHRGCIPSKALLRTAEVYHTAKQAPIFGVEVAGTALNWPKALERKRQLVQTLFLGVQALLRKNGVTVLQGRGSIVKMDPDAHRGRRTFTLEAGDRKVQGAHVIVATGSRPVTLGLPVGERIMTSDQALERPSLPQSVIIIGAGAIGMEWASLYSDCGAAVTVVEKQPRILPAEDEDIAKEAMRLFAKRGVRFHCGAAIEPREIEETSGGVRVPIRQADGTTAVLEAEMLLLSVGRSANVEGVIDGSRSGTGLLDTERGFVRVTSRQETNLAGIFAIGDVCGGGLAHAAAMQGNIAAEAIAGLDSKPYRPLKVPKCTYTRPEIASVGYTESGAAEAGFRVRIGKFPFRAIGKALVFGEFDGFAKVVAEEATGEVLGVHLIGPHATDLVSEGGVVLANGLRTGDWLKAVHPHPVLSEAFHEALLMTENRAIHL